MTKRFVIVCGGRDYDDWGRLDATLKHFIKEDDVRMKNGKTRMLAD